MHKAVSIFPTGASITPTDLAIACEERGFESLWVAEHSHIPVSRKTPFPGGGDLPKMYFDVMDPFVCLAAAAAVTKRLKLATGVCLLIQPRRWRTTAPISIGASCCCASASKR